MLKKLPFIIPLLALIALLVWWFTPHYTAEEEAYYRAVFCMIDHEDSRQFLDDMPVSYTHLTLPTKLEV